MERNNLLTIVIGALIIVITVPLVLYLMSEPEIEKEPVDPPRFMIPAFITEDGEADFYNDRIYFRDYSNMMHAISIIAAMSRTSEIGNAAYRDGRWHEHMGDRAQQWLNLMMATDSYFNEYGKFIEYYSASGDKWLSSGSTNLADYPHGVYAYHFHHRGDRFSDFGNLEDQLYRIPAKYISDPGSYLLGEHYYRGRFGHAEGNVDHKSMSYGLGGLNGHFYAWVRWKKPGGADDMGLVSLERMIQFLGSGPEELTEISREIAEFLDKSWNQNYRIYDFGDGFTWQLDAIGAMIRGHKSLYDMLYMFGDEQDKAMAQTLFERSLVIYQNVEPLIKPWGLPERITFSTTGAEAGSETVDTYSWYQFLNHIDGGYSWLRERDGTSRFFERLNPEAKSAVNEMTDRALIGGMQYHINNGRLVSTVNYNDGSITDTRTGISATGMFITFAGNHYTNGASFAQASDWNNASQDVVERSAELYDLMTMMYRQLEILLLQI